MDEKYVPYRIEVQDAEKWIDRPHKVSFITDWGGGSTAQAVYLDEKERKDLIRALGGIVPEEPREYWVFEGDTSAFWAGSNNLEEAKRYLSEPGDYIRPMYLGKRLDIEA